MNKERKGACAMILSDWNTMIDEEEVKRVSGKYGLGQRIEFNPETD